MHGMGDRGRGGLWRERAAGLMRGLMRGLLVRRERGRVSAGLGLGGCGVRYGTNQSSFGPRGTIPFGFNALIE
jgi:hypothetical protein